MSTGLIPHHGGEVYGAGSSPVNPRMAAGWVTALVLAAGGCTAAPSTQVPYPVGILYGVEPAAALGSDDLQRCMERDFASLRKLGFDTVFIQH
ncbi:MAG: hypothetical protein ACYSUQ_06620, partial [Planctomycetota bacterium]